MARSTSPDWMSHLPLVLLGVRASVREDSGTSPAELLYGTVLRLPGQMLQGLPPADVFRPSSDFVRDLQMKMKRAVPMPVLYHNKNRPVHLPANLRTAAHVFVRIDAVKPPLTRPYEGPFKVLSRSNDLKTFTLDRAGRSWVVSVDRLKPAFSHADPSSSSPAVPGGALGPVDPPLVELPPPPLDLPAVDPVDLAAQDVLAPVAPFDAAPPVAQAPHVPGGPRQDVVVDLPDAQAAPAAPPPAPAPAPVQTRSGRVSRPPTCFQAGT